MSFRANGSILVAAAPAALHLVTALLCTLLLGVDIENGPLRWDAFWQTVPLADLREALRENLLALHGQPPLHNAAVGVLARLSEQPLTLLHAIHIGQGAGLCAMAALLVADATDSRVLGLALGSMLALYPALLLYEAYPLYTLPTAFLVMTALFAIGRFQRDRRERWLLVFVLALTLLVLLRSLYHTALLGPVIALAVWLSRERRRMLLVALLIALPALGWSARNLVVHGGPGGSSWAGCNLWKIASARHSGPTLVSLARDGAIDPMVLTVPVFSPPAAYRAHGFDRRSGVPALDRNDHHNVNIPAICRVYGRSAARLIAQSPAHYAGNVWLAYQQFSRPSSGHAHLTANARRLGWLGRVSLGPIFLVLVPVTIALPFLGIRRRRGRGLLEAWRRRPLLPLAALLIAYTATVSSCADLGENERFKFAIELPVLCAVCIAAGEGWQRRRKPPAVESGSAYARPGSTGESA